MTQPTRNLFAAVSYAASENMTPFDLNAVNTRIDKDLDKHIAGTRRLLMQPSSSQEHIGIEKCAELVGKMFENAGCDKVEITDTKGNPIVRGECKGDSDNTLLIYFMYDTMPFNEPGWHSPPLGAKIVEKRLVSGKVKAMVNRGAANTKGPLAAFVNVLDACNKSVGRPPINLILLAEGEEELGSPSLPAYVKKEKKHLSKADALYFPFFSQDTDGSITLLLGNKGCVYFELECSGKEWGRGPQEFAIHSSNKAWVDSPVWRLVEALGTMVEDNGNRVLIDGFYNDIRPPTGQEEKLIADATKSFNPRAMKDEMKISKFTVPETDKKALLERVNFESTLNIDGIWAGWTEPGSKTILPHKATCKIDIRLVPEQDKEKMLTLVRRHLDKYGYGDIKLTEIDNYIDWSKCDVNEPVVQSMLRSLRKFRCKHSVWPLDPSSVPYYIFTRTLDIPFTNGGIGHAALSHSPNEYMVIEGNNVIAGFADAEKFMAFFIDDFAHSR